MYVGEIPTESDESAYQTHCHSSNADDRWNAFPFAVTNLETCHRPDRIMPSIFRVCRLAVGAERKESLRFRRQTPRRVTASVAIPASYYEDVWRQQQGLSLKEVERQEQAKIESSILALLPVPEDSGVDAKPRLVVRTFQPIRIASVEKPTPQDRALAWCGEHTSAIGMGFLGLVSLLIVRSIARSGPREPATDSRAIVSISEEENGVPWPSPAPTRTRENRPDAPTLRDELVDIVRDDPDAAASVLRKWISAAS